MLPKSEGYAESLLISIQYWARGSGHKRWPGDKAFTSIPAIRAWWIMQIEVCPPSSNPAVNKVLMLVYYWSKQKGQREAAIEPSGPLFTLPEFKKKLDRMIRDIQLDDALLVRKYSKGGKRILKPRC